ncbi:MAG: hypothetical protein HPY54_14290 [Chthonomonadetes bacterium]|nr:hypothetical protein [Chthonomonadetes bacterium]
MAYRSTRRGHTPPVRGKKRVRHVLSAFGSLVVVGVVLFVAGRLLFSFGDRVMMLAREAHRHRQEIAALRQETEWYREQNAILQRQIQTLHTRSGIILEARRQGYGFPGERLLVMEPSPTQPESQRK